MTKEKNIKINQMRAFFDVRNENFTVCDKKKEQGI